MRRTTQVRAAGVVAAVALGVWAWSTWWPSDERAIRRRLEALASAVNEAAPEGVGTITRAAGIGSYFTEDVVVDLGVGNTPIQGREALIGVAARVNPSSAGYTLEFDDLAVDVGESGSASVRCAATLTRTNRATGERITDARELQLAMTKADGSWRIARVTALDTLRRE
ncbi:MAG TPA: nuclear transport factor 2 family protein [Vicinamibacterales bacterium]|nr:nuclear transport factor 2 family protein [Vicinamibacterales bacterium]